MEYYDILINDIDMEEGNLLVRIDIEKGGKYIQQMNIALDMEYMGLKWEDEFEDELRKDFNNAFNKLALKTNTLPTEEELKKEVERNYYGN